MPTHCIALLHWVLCLWSPPPWLPRCVGSTRCGFVCDECRLNWINLIYWYRYFLVVIEHPKPDKATVTASFSEVEDVVCNENQVPFHDLPSIIMCKDGYNGPDNWVPIAPIVSHFMVDQVKCSRQQFPLHICYACSIHKSEGLTLERAVIDIGADAFYVG